MNQLEARLQDWILAEPGSTLLALKMAFWVAALSVFIKLMPLPRALRLVAPRLRRARPLNSSEIQERLARLLDSVLVVDFFNR